MKQITLSFLPIITCTSALIFVRLYVCAGLWVRALSKHCMRAVFCVCRPAGMRLKQKETFFCDGLCAPQLPETAP